MMNKNSSQRRRGLRVSQSEFVGRRLLPARDPVPIVSQPWNTVTLMIRKPAQNGPWILNVAEIRLVMKAQLGLQNVKDTSSPPTGNDVQFEFRLISFNMWCSASQIVVFPMDVMNASTSRPIELARLDTFAGKTAFARVGYEYPITVRSTPVSTLYDSDKTLLTCEISGKTGDIECQLHILWKCAFTGIAKLAYEYKAMSNLSGSSSIDGFQNVQSDLSRIQRFENNLIMLTHELSNIRADVDESLGVADASGTQ